MNSNEKKIIIAIFIIVILIIILLILINRLKQFNDIEDDTMQQDIIVNNEVISKLNTYYIFDIEDRINKLLENIQDEHIVAVQSVLQDNEMHTEMESLKYSEFFIQEVYSSENEKNGKFYIYGLGKNEEQALLEDIYFIMDVDYNNSAYEISLSNSETFEQAKKGKREQVKDKIIKPDGYNNIEISTLTTDELLNKYIKDYKNKCLYGVKYAYDMLDEECKSEKFNTLEKYIEYVKNNKENIINMKLTSYTKEIEDEYIQYDILCNDNKYIVKARGVMNYTINI